MSEPNLFQKLFSRKPNTLPAEGDMAVVDISPETTAALASTSVLETASQAAEPQAKASRADVKGDGEVLDQNLLSIPVLGRRTVVAHQRIFAGMLALALVVLALVTFFALTQADKVSQQLSATGQALMQSQRLAKSVSQALVGSPQAFPDVKESAEVLSKTVRGLKAGDEAMRIEAVP